MPQSVRNHPSRRWPWLIPLFFVLLGSLPSLFGSGCFWREAIGLPCPTCGTSRALLLLLDGRAADAFGMHPMIFIYLPFLLAVSLTAFAFLLGRRGRPRIGRDDFFSGRLRRTAQRACFGVLILTYVVYAIRMPILFPQQEPLTWNNEAWLPSLIRVIGAFFRR